MHKIHVVSPPFSQVNGPRRTPPPVTILIIIDLPEALAVHNPMNVQPRARSRRPSNARKMMKIVVWVRHLPEIRLKKNAVALSDVVLTVHKLPNF